jgi:hypothetical protein
VAAFRKLAQQATPYEINAVLALTGAAAFIGKSEEQSLRLIERSPIAAVASKPGRVSNRCGLGINSVVMDRWSSAQKDFVVVSKPVEV